MQVSISPIFYKQLFHMKVFCTAFMCLQFGFVIFWQKDFGAKAANKMLVKLTPVHVAGMTIETKRYKNSLRNFKLTCATTRQGSCLTHKH
jgi:hypothetical protein